MKNDKFKGVWGEKTREFAFSLIDEIHQELLSRSDGSGRLRIRDVNQFLAAKYRFDKDSSRLVMASLEEQEHLQVNPRAGQITLLKRRCKKMNGQKLTPKIRNVLRGFTVKK